MLKNKKNNGDIRFFIVIRLISGRTGSQNSAPDSLRLSIVALFSQKKATLLHIVNSDILRVEVFVSCWRTIKIN